jgi:hypothetical protein
MTTTTATHTQAKNAVDSLFNAFCDSAPINETDLSLSFEGIDNSKQIRDYVLGLIGLNLADHADRFRFLNLFTVCGESAYLDEIKGAYLYEAGKTEEALETLYKVQNGALARLLIRVIGSGWPVDAFAAMRNELHEKVVEGLLTDYADKPVNNA